MALHYNAFISYRHAPLDMKIAARIQRDLERLHIPKEIREKTGVKKIERIFRDKEELSITSDLGDNITTALENSDFLIVICSVNTASSKWVQREIEIFLRTHDNRHVLTVLADGEPEQVIPEILNYEEAEVHDSDGRVFTERRRTDLLSCDYRKKRLRAKREELPRLAAALLGCGYDELRQRQRHHRIRQMTAAFSAALALVSAIAAFAVNRAFVISRQADMISRQAKQLEEEYENTLISQSRYLAEKSVSLLAQGDRMGAIQVALSALPASEADTSRPLVTEAIYALNNAVYPYHIAQENEFLAKCMLKTDGGGGNPEDYWISPGGTRYMTGDSAGQIYIFDLEKDIRLCALTPGDVLPDAGETEFLSADFLSEDWLILYFKSCAVCWDLQTGTALWNTAYERAGMPQESFRGAESLVDHRHQTLAAVLWGSDAFGLYQFDEATGRILSFVWSPMPERGLYPSTCRIALSPDGSRAAVGFADNAFQKDGAEEPVIARLMLADLKEGSCRMISVEKGDVAAICFGSDDLLFAFSADMGYADYINNAFHYTVEGYSFDTGSLVWSDSGNLMVEREVGEEVLPSCMMQNWQRTLDDGTAEELLVAQFAGRLLLIEPQDGSILRTVDFSADIMSICTYNAGEIFLALRDGRLMLYLPVSSSISPMGSVSGKLLNAGFNQVMGEFLLALEDSRSIVIMSNGIEDSGIGKVSFEDSTLQAEYDWGEEWEYRIVRKYPKDQYDSQQLLFYLPLSDTFFASTDAVGEKTDFHVLHREDGEDVCYYLNRGEDRSQVLCGWDLENDKKVFEYPLGGTTVSSLCGFYRDQILLRTGSVLRMIDPSHKTEKTTEIEGFFETLSYSPESRYLAVLTSAEGKRQLQLLDLEQWTWVELSPELQALEGSARISSGSLSFSPDGNKLAVCANGGFLILGLKELSIEQEVLVSCRSEGRGLFLNDHIFLVYGDSGHLTTWDLNTRAVVMEDPNDIDSVKNLTCKDGFFRMESGMDTWLYGYSQDGRIALELTLDYAAISPSGSEVLSYYNDSGYGKTSILVSISAFKIYPMFTLDQLVEKAKDVLDGRTLTNAEKIQYFIDN